MRQMFSLCVAVNRLRVPGLARTVCSGSSRAGQRKCCDPPNPMATTMVEPSRTALGCYVTKGCEASVCHAKHNENTG